MKQELFSAFPWMFPTLIIAIAWEVLWKLIAFWKAARNNHLAWYICIAVFNTLGILPIIYIILYREKK
jgi:hypothetical protein